MSIPVRKDLEARIPAGDADYDVIVCGSGMAGLGAASAAAAQGAKTLLLERRTYMGGIAHTCLWMSANGLHVPGRYGAKIATDFVEIANRWKITGLERCLLYSVGSEVALRETRRIIGDYYLTAQDAVEGPPFEDVVAVDYCKGADTVHYHSAGQRIKSIPYRCLLPKGLEGILMAGRCVSASQAALGAVRGMGTRMEMGQAAGVAAALAVANRCAPRRVDVGRIQERLRAMGVRLFPQDLEGIEGV
jgi:choline dehydrogenase-like flavoprotein